jgi:hypothetical protein
MPFASFSRAPLKNKTAQYSLNTCIKTILAFPEPVTGNAPPQFFGQPAVKNDHSQIPDFFLPVFCFGKIKINLWIHAVIAFY